MSTPSLRADDASLADAAEEADWGRVEQLIKEGEARPDVAQVDGMTALHWAAWHDHTSTVHRLIELRIMVSPENRYGVTPLALACTNGNAEIIRLLLDAGADANASLPGDETVLMRASRSGCDDGVRLLLEHGAKVDAKEQKGQTAIMWAAAEGHARVVSLLLRAGADYQSPLRSGFTPLFLAVREGQAKIVDVLLAANADVNGVMRPQNSGGRNPRRGTSPLVLAVENGHFELAVTLLEAGANPNDQRSGFTPLHAITWVRKPNLGDGIDGEPSPIGSGNVTSLQFVRQLVEHGADVNRKLRQGRSGRGVLNRTGATPFLMAADTADVPLMKLLLELGADPTIANADDCPPLLAAVGIGTRAPGEEAGTEPEAIEAVRLMLELGADINAVDKNGETVLHGAAYASWPKMVEFLTEHGADVEVWNRKNRYGWTPLLIAEGYRPGNFKPAAATIKAVRAAMRKAGVEPPPPSKRKSDNDEYKKKT